MKKTSWLLIAAVVAASCCVLSMGAVMLLGLVGPMEPTPTVSSGGGGPPAPADDGSLVGTWSTTTLGLQPYDTTTGAWGPLNAEGRTLTLRDDGSFESVWVKSLRGMNIGTYLAGDWQLDGSQLTLTADTWKTTAGGQPALVRTFRVARRQQGDIAYLSITDVDTNVTEQLRRE